MLIWYVPGGESYNLLLSVLIIPDLAGGILTDNLHPSSSHTHTHTHTLTLTHTHTNTHSHTHTHSHSHTPTHT